MTRAAILTLRRDHWSVSAIAKRVGCSERWVWRVLGGRNPSDNAVNLKVAYRRVLIRDAKRKGARRLPKLFRCGKTTIHDALHPCGGGWLGHDFSSRKAPPPSPQADAYRDLDAYLHSDEYRDTEYHGNRHADRYLNALDGDRRVDGH